MSDYWVTKHECKLLSDRKKIRVHCMTDEAILNAESAAMRQECVGYHGRAWDITKIKNICDGVMYFEAERLETVKGASLGVAFNLD